MNKQINDEDLKRVAEKIKFIHGYDFLNYAQPSFRRRVQRILELKKLTVAHLLEKIEEHPEFIDEFIKELTVNVTEMFRDPPFWSLLRNTLLPAMAAKGPLRIWHAGCSTGEEVFSMAILLKELGIYRQAKILATDLGDSTLQKARAGTYPAKTMALNTTNYVSAGGDCKLSDYSIYSRDKVVFDPHLLSNVTFERHDLVTDQMDRQFEFILCRNVMIYFNQDLQNNVLKKFHSSLVHKGHLAMGSKESLAWHDVTAKFTQDDRSAKVYRKISS